uniref:Uncharacterized protein n=1 Tax=Avena sativa TaxID=4498 RepID=A0ACD5VY93_AVESA
MGIFSGTPPPSCPSSRRCAQWAQTYLKYCLCSTKDSVALGLGLASVLSWGVAEVPQIITNYKQKSTEGLSIAFLMTWVVGDLFNLVGCFLEPATLPTQFYMALLYTITTLILTGQTIYYSHIYCLKVKKTGATGKPQKHHRGDASLREKLLGQRDDASKNNIQSGVTIPVPSSPIQVNAEVFWQRHGAISPSSDYYYVSARSLSRSPVPIAGTWLGNNRQTTRASPQMNDQGESGEFAPAQSAPAAITKNSLAVVPWISVLLGMCVLHILVGSAHRDVPNEIIIPVGRKLLALADDHADIGSGIGSFLGWAMAVIYMGGRLPQIYLNMQRGHAEGLNPLMFTFALVGNTTYVGSILVNSLDWARLKPNLPWLVDAAGCVLLDSFIILQFLYFHYRKQSGCDEVDNVDKA